MPWGLVATIFVAGCGAATHPHPLPQPSLHLPTPTAAQVQAWQADGFGTTRNAEILGFLELYYNHAGDIVLNSWHHTPTRTGGNYTVTTEGLFWVPKNRACAGNAGTVSVIQYGELTLEVAITTSQHQLHIKQVAATLAQETEGQVKYVCH